MTGTLLVRASTIDVGSARPLHEVTQVGCRYACRRPTPGTGLMPVARPPRRTSASATPVSKTCTALPG